MTDSLVEFNKLSDQDISLKGEEFKAYMTFLHSHAGKFAFSKWRVFDGQEKRMSTFNAAVYDAVSVGLSEAFSLNDMRDKSAEVASELHGYRILFSNPEFFSAVSGSVNDAAKVVTRIDLIISYLTK